MVLESYDSVSCEESRGAKPECKLRCCGLRGPELETPSAGPRRPQQRVTQLAARAAVEPLVARSCFRPADSVDSVNPRSIPEKTGVCTCTVPCRCTSHVRKGHHMIRSGESLSLEHGAVRESRIGKPSGKGRL